jgi:S-DNA-T family DNA segregation ATPase FtsK/SpoIIIE
MAEPVNDGRELVNAVFDAELVDDPPQAVYRDAKLNWLVSWWLRAPRVPAALKSRLALVQAVKDRAVAVLRSPWRYAGSVVRGIVAALRWWRRWVTVRDFREAAEQSEKLADKFSEIRLLTLFRWKVTGAALLATALGVAIADLLYGTRALWITVLAGSVALSMLGRRKDGSPGRKAVLAGPRTLTWTMDPQVLVDAFRDAKLIGKDETLRLVERATRVGDGWAITVDLPATRKAADVIKNREALASALAVDEVQLIVERVRGNGGHAGRVSMWVADEDPYAAPPLRTPLLAVQGWDAWRAIPFGRDARGPQDRPAAGVDFAAGWCDSSAGQDVCCSSGRCWLDPRSVHAPVRGGLQGGQGLGRCGSCGAPVHVRRRVGACVGAGGLVG